MKHWPDTKTLTISLSETRPTGAATARLPDARSTRQYRLSDGHLRHRKAQYRARCAVLLHYAQGYFSIGASVDFVAGLRYDRFEINGNDLIGSPRPFARNYDKILPRIGLIVKPQENI